MEPWRHQAKCHTLSGAKLGDGSERKRTAGEKLLKTSLWEIPQGIRHTFCGSKNGLVHPTSRLEIRSSDTAALILASGACVSERTTVSFQRFCLTATVVQVQRWTRALTCHTTAHLHSFSCSHTLETGITTGNAKHTCKPATIGPALRVVAFALRFTALASAGQCRRHKDRLADSRKRLSFFGVERDRRETRFKKKKKNDARRARRNSG